jgi:hypothetical protein
MADWSSFPPAKLPEIRTASLIDKSNIHMQLYRDHRMCSSVLLLSGDSMVTEKETAKSSTR